MCSIHSAAGEPPWPRWLGKYTVKLFARRSWNGSQRPAPPGRELALEQHVADHPPITGHRVEREETDARQLFAASLPVEAPEQLVATAHG